MRPVATPPGHGAHEDYAWWNALCHGGLLVAPSRLPLHFPPQLEPVPATLAERLRTLLLRVQVHEAGRDNEFLDAVLSDLCGLGRTGQWRRGPEVPADLGRRAASGELLKPRWVWRGDLGGELPVFVVPLGEAPRLGIGRGRRATARVVEWLRLAQRPVALLTNLQQWRLIYAGLDHEAWAESDTERWFEEGQPAPQLDALRALLGPDSLAAPAQGESPKLVQAILDTRRGEAELSAALGERVRLAVERLIQAYAPVLDGYDERPEHLYRAAVRMVMRLVILLFAEARDLFPRDHPVYGPSYSLEALRQDLDRHAEDGRLRHRWSAWPRLLALSRLVYYGSSHPELPLLDYGGQLFRPGDRQSDDPVARALAAFETVRPCPSDQVVQSILDLLTRTRSRIRQGNRTIVVQSVVDFSDLSSEYIGILYEGLLDFELRRADDTVVFLNLGDQPALPLTRLEGMSDAGLATLVEKAKKSSRKLAGGDAEDEASDEDEEAEDADSPDEAEDEPEEEAPDEPTDEEAVEEPGDERHRERERSVTWALRAVAAGKLVPKPRGRAQRDAYEAAARERAEQLISRVVLPGEWYLVRWGGTRKGSGTFYTRPQLAVPTVIRTLLPLVCEPPLKDGQPDEDAPPAEWSPKTPDVILAQQVCDPAMGSGSFLVAALRALTDWLFRSLLANQWLVERDGRLELSTELGRSPDWLDDVLSDCPLDHPEPEAYIQARLKRLIVERCLYGVDLDPLAVELAKLSLWVETMDRSLRFEFLDHKLKHGNALIGCWFDRFADYPLLAWDREGGDKGHTRGTHYENEAWTKAIKAVRNGPVKREMAAAIAAMSGDRQLNLFDRSDAPTPEALHQRAVEAYELLQATSVTEPGEREQAYHTEYEADVELQRLKLAFDTWCAVWFWPADAIDDCPLPTAFHQLSDGQADTVRRLREEHRFFHWELEFPDVFRAPGDGFSAVVGNPPWETLQPSSKEFFSNVDPLYRTYGKQEALRRQAELFAAHAGIEHDWLAYCAGYKALTQFLKTASSPFGDSPLKKLSFSLANGRRSTALHERWRELRSARRGFAQSAHPFARQGFIAEDDEDEPPAPGQRKRRKGSKCYTYKLFLEQGWSLLRSGGQLGLLVPSGLYTDEGSTDLRRLFIDDGNWRWLFAFENREGIFADVASRLKFCPVIAGRERGAGSVRAAFMRHDPADWSSAEDHVLPYPPGQIRLFSPDTLALLEVQNRRDLALLEELYARAVRLGDTRPGGWDLQYAQGDFNMTTDSKLFPLRSRWEADGYVPDIYGRWVKAARVIPSAGSSAALSATVEPGLILLQDGGTVPEDEIQGVALPFYQGPMIWELSPTAAQFVGGGGQGARWRRAVSPDAPLLPQHLMDPAVFRDRSGEVVGLRLVFRAMTNATNERTSICCLIDAFPCGNSLGTIALRQPQHCTFGVACAAMGSFVFDWTLRFRIPTQNVNIFHLQESVWPGPRVAGYRQAAVLAFRLTMAALTRPLAWLRLRAESPDVGRGLARQLATTQHERLRLRCALDAVVAELYGLDWDDLAYILRDCDHPVEHVTDKAFARGLAPKGFWRVDKTQPPELRHSVLTLIAFQDLKDTIRQHGGDSEAGIRAFCEQHDGDGWMLPETLRLADYGLGHDERAKVAQPVAEALGERFLPWQLEQSAEESWRECEIHARNILGEAGYRALQAELRGEGGAPKAAPADEYPPEWPRDLLGEPLPRNVLGEPVYPEGRRGRRR